MPSGGPETLSAAAIHSLVEGACAARSTVVVVVVASGELSEPGAVVTEEEAEPSVTRAEIASEACWKHSQDWLQTDTVSL